MKLINESKKVLIACPTSIDKLYCQDEWLEWILQFTYPNTFIYVVDNSENNNGNSKIIDKKLAGKGKCSYYKPKSNLIRHTILACSNRIRDYFLKNNYDYVLWLESDMFPPLNIIEHLIALNKQVIGLPYFHYEKEDTKLMLSSVDNIMGVHYSDYHPQQKGFLMCNGDLINAYQSGMGCLLINRKIIKQIPFRIDERPMADMGFKNGKIDRGGFNKGFPDHFFHQDCASAGIPILLDSRFYAVHLNTGMAWKKIYEKKKL